MMALIYCRVRRIQVITRSDSNIAKVRNEPRLKRGLRRILLRCLFPRDTRVWTIGEANQSFWAEYIGRRNTTRVPYAVPRLPDSTGVTPQKWTMDPDSIRVLYVGRLHPAKRPELLVRAFQQLSEARFAGWSLSIVGDGPLRKQLTAEASSDPRIRLHGASEYQSLDRYYLEADVFVLPSAVEAWGLVVNEALGFGLWTVVSDQVGARELIVNEEYGATFSDGSLEELVNKLRDAPNHLRRMPRGAPAPTAQLMELDLRTLGISSAAGR